MEHNKPLDQRSDGSQSELIITTQKKNAGKTTKTNHSRQIYNLTVPTKQIHNSRNIKTHMTKAESSSAVGCQIQRPKSRRLIWTPKVHVYRNTKKKHYKFEIQTKKPHKSKRFSL